MYVLTLTCGIVHRRYWAPMLYSSSTLARNASSILSLLSRLPSSLSAHPLIFTLSTNAATASLTPPSPRSPHSLRPAALVVSPHPRTPVHISHARWHSFTRVTLRLSGAIYRGGRRRRLEDGMLCGRREMRRDRWEGVNLHCWRKKTWIGRTFGIVALLASHCPCR